MFKILKRAAIAAVLLTPLAGPAWAETCSSVTINPIDSSSVETICTPVNHPPVAVDDSNSGLAGTELTGNVLTNDTDPDAGQQLSVVQPNAAGINADGSYAISSAVPGQQWLDYEVTDGTLVDQGQLVLTFLNNPPVAVDDTGSGFAGQAVVGNVLSNDTNFESGQSLSVVQPNANIAADGSFNITNNVLGAHPYPYEVTDGTDVDAGELVITVNNNPPVAVDDVDDGFAGTSLTGNVLTNDTNFESGQQLSVVQPNAGGINADGSYAISNNVPGLVNVPYEVTDGLASDSGNLALTYHNNPPVAVDDSNSGVTGTPVVGNVLTNDTNFESGQTLSVVQPNSNIAANGAYSITSATAGTVHYPYTVTDGSATDVGDLAITYTAASNPISIFHPATPAGGGFTDVEPVDLGFKFTTSANGQITGLRYYKATGETGSHVGTLWTSAGASLGTVTFTGESASGWQTASFATPIPVTAGQTYVASYRSNGRYHATSGYFNTARTNGPLTAPTSASSGGNGVFKYGATGFPNQTFNATSYWVDVVFVEGGSPPPQLSNVSWRVRTLATSANEGSQMTYVFEGLVNGQPYVLQSGESVWFEFNQTGAQLEDFTNNQTVDAQAAVTAAGAGHAFEVNGGTGNRRITFSAGQDLSINVPRSIVADSTTEGAEQVTMTILGVQAGTIGTSSVQWTINDTSTGGGGGGSGFWPGPNNTGPDAGVTLTNYTGSLVISQSNAVLENFRFNVPGSALRITGNNNTIRNCEINDTGNAQFLITMEGTGNILEKCDINGRGNSGNTANLVWMGSNNTLRLNDMDGAGNGPIIDGDGVTVYRNYIHDLATNAQDPHYDGIAMHGVPGTTEAVTIEENTIASRDTSGIFMKDDFGSITNITIRKNLLIGNAGWQILATNAGSGGSTTNIIVNNNHIEMGAYAHVFFETGVTNNYSSGANVEYSVGNAPAPGSAMP